MDHKNIKREFTKKLDHVVKKHNFIPTTFLVPMQCMHCSKYIILSKELECKACKFKCHKKCSSVVADNCGDLIPEKEKESEVMNLSMLARVGASTLLNAISPEQQHDMFIVRIKDGDKKAAEYMLDKYIASNSADINMQDSLGNTALHYMMGNYGSNLKADAELKMCYESGLILRTLKSPQLLCNVANKEGNTPLHYLCAKFLTIDCVEIGEMLLKRGADVNAQNAEGETPLHKASLNGSVRVLLAKLLVSHKADLNSTNKRGETPLHYAVRLNRTDLAKFLLKKGAVGDIVSTKEHKTPLQLATEHGYHSLANLLQRVEEVTNLLKRLELQAYLKKFVAYEAVQGNVMGVIDDTLLTELEVVDPTHRTTLLQHKSSRRPRLNTESGRQLHHSIMESTRALHLHSQGDSWIIQNEEVVYLKKLGGGASGTVFKGLFLGMEVAIKVVKKELSEVGSEAVEEFVKEFSTMLYPFNKIRLKSPYIVSVFGAILEPEICLVMELAHLGSLYHVLKDPNFNSTWESTIKFGIEAAEGMAFLHSLQPPLLHRDMKTLNLMVTRERLIKVGDFGLSIFENAKKAEGGMAGTAAYLAPEVLEGGPSSTKVDVFAFGIVWWELVNATLKKKYEPPYHELESNIQILGAVMEDERPGIPSNCPNEVATFLNTLWHRNPEERPEFSTIVQMLHTLQANQGTWVQNDVV